MAVVVKNVPNRLKLLNLNEKSRWSIPIVFVIFWINLTIEFLILTPQDFIRASSTKILEEKILSSPKSWGVRPVLLFRFAPNRRSDVISSQRKFMVFSSILKHCNTSCIKFINDETTTNTKKLNCTRKEKKRKQSNHNNHQSLPCLLKNNYTIKIYYTIPCTIIDTLVCFTFQEITMTISWHCNVNDLNTQLKYRIPIPLQKTITILYWIF